MSRDRTHAGGARYILYFLPNLVPSSAFGESFNRCFHCAISAQNEHPESSIRCTSTCG